MLSVARNRSTIRASDTVHRRRRPSPVLDCFHQVVVLLLVLQGLRMLYWVLREERTLGPDLRSWSFNEGNVGLVEVVMEDSALANF